MKRSEIVDGGQYSDGKGHVREVVPGDFYFVARWNQRDSDLVRYRKIDSKITEFPDGTMTRAAFAKWAKEKVS